MHLRRYLATFVVATTLTLLLIPSVALAHERRTIAGGKYDVVVGWDVEPAIEGQKNAASIRVSRAGSNPAEPVEGAERTLTLQVRQGGQTREVPLRAAFGQKGYYLADLVPTRAGDYQFIFGGTIGGDQVSETFDTADGKFNAVESLAALQFPAAVGGPSELVAQAQQAQVEAQSARTLALLGLGVGALGLVAGLAAWMRRPAAAEARAATRRVPQGG